MFVLGNIQDDEELYQRCVLVSGMIVDCPDDGFVHVTTRSDSDATLFPDQRWPLVKGHFKALLMLTPGTNRITLRSSHDDAVTSTLSLRYIPLLQTPPLHLAVLVAQDSPLLIDCPPCKYGGLSTTHSSLDAALAKFRLTAYMWQALTAEEFRSQGLGRRSFRLEEEYGLPDTLSSTFSPAATSAAAPSFSLSPAKIHLIRTPHTVAYLRDAQRAQQNPSGSRRDELHTIFSTALRAHGAPFTTAARPIVAGLLLDAAYAPGQSMLLGHAALGAHDPAGLSLGIFGSHLTYAWPRFLEEVPLCLSDATPPGDMVCNDNGECTTCWRACAVGQGAFLHEVGHAFGAPHSSGIMMRGYSPDWVKVFLPTEGAGRDEQHDCHWDLADLLRFKALGQFKVPQDGEVDGAMPEFEIIEEGDEGEGDAGGVKVSCEAGLGMVLLNGTAEEGTSVREPKREVRLGMKDLEDRFRRGKPLELVAVGMNGKQKKTDVWKLLTSKAWVRVPGTKIKLLKKCVGEEKPDEEEYQWAVMLKKRGRDGKLVAASKIDIRVGCALDGAVVHYRDGKSVPCGERREGGYHDDSHGMGGHQAKKISLRKDSEVVKVAINTTGGWGLAGMRLWLADGRAMGALNKSSADCKEDIKILTPDDGHRIIGFYGATGLGGGLCHRFGIVTAPKDIDLPDFVYDMEELRNDAQVHRKRKNGSKDQGRKRQKQESESETEDDQSHCEDDDDEYDTEVGDDVVVG
ncbi:metallopeptidase [Podospora conica]|nr:metallopeptidase [Schizothecium conicum]